MYMYLNISLFQKNQKLLKISKLNSYSGNEEKILGIFLDDEIFDKSELVNILNDETQFKDLVEEALETED